MSGPDRMPAPGSIAPLMGRRHPLPRSILAVVALALATGACGAADGASPTTTVAPAATPATTATNAASRPPADLGGFRTQPTACGASAPPAPSSLSFDAPGDMGLDPAIPVTATVTTSCGDVVLELDPALAPATVNSFVFLAEQGYFDGTVAHRVAPGFVVQAGDPTATGMGGPGYVVPDELPPAGTLYEQGTIAMANAGPGTTGSQFFIMLSDAALPTNYSVFGKVVAGTDTLARIAAVPLGSNPRGEVSVPLETVYLERVTVAP